MYSLADKFSREFIMFQDPKTPIYQQVLKFIFQNIQPFNDKKYLMKFKEEISDILSENIILAQFFSQCTIECQQVQQNIQQQVQQECVIEPQIIKTDAKIIGQTYLKYHKLPSYYEYQVDNYKATDSDNSGQEDNSIMKLLQQIQLLQKQPFTYNDLIKLYQNICQLKLNQKVKGYFQHVTNNIPQEIQQIIIQNSDVWDIQANNQSYNLKTLIKLKQNKDNIQRNYN